MTIETQNSKDYPVEHGPRQGETIIFLHGGNMAGWTWDSQVEAMPDRHLLTPDLPGYGRNTHERMGPGIAEAADRMAELIRSHSIGGQAHIVGLSLGGFVAIELIRRHPALAYTCTISGSPLLGYTWWERTVIGAQVPLWHRRWYWIAQSARLTFRWKIGNFSRKPPAARNHSQTLYCSGNLGFGRCLPSRSPSPGRCLQLPPSTIRLQYADPSPAAQVPTAAAHLDCAGDASRVEC